MAEEKVGIKIEVDGSQVTKSVGNVRKELKEANAELVRAQQEFGDYSAEAVAAAKKVALLRDQISEAAETAKLFDPGAKFAAFSGAINAVAGGFAAVQGALGLVGVESEDLQKQLLKVQSALALSEGLSKVTDSAKDFQRLSAVIQQTSVFQKGLAAANLVTAATQKVLGVATNVTSVGFKVLRGAIIGTGIGALAIGLIALVQNFDKVKKVVLNLIPGLGAIADAIGGIYDKVTDFLGITSEAERQSAKLLKENADAIRATERELEINGDKYDEYTTRKIEANLKYRKSVDELNKAVKDEGLSIEERDRLLAASRARANRDIAAADKDRQASIDKANKEAADKAAKAAKEAADKRKAAQKEQQQIQDEGQKELAQLINDNEKAITETSIENENERAKKLIDIQLKQDTDRVNATKLSAELKAKIVAELEKKAQIERDKVQKKIDDEEKKRAEETAKRVADIRTEIVENSITDETERRLFGIRAKYAAEIAEVEKGEGDVAALVAALKERQQQEEDAVEKERKEKKAAERIAELEEIIGNNELDFGQREEALAELRDLNQRYLDADIISKDQNNKLLKKIADAEVAIDKEKFEKLKGNLAAYAQLLNQASELVGKNTVAGKAAAIAAATINTFLSASNAFNAMSKVPPSPFVAIAAAGLATAAGIKQIREIAKVQVPGVGGGGGGPVPSIPAPSVGGSLPGMNAAAPLSPDRPSAQVFRLDQQSIQGINSTTQRAYVVESDITSSQERVTRLNRAARLG
jgi:hypothetical protein